MHFHSILSSGISSLIVETIQLIINDTVTQIVSLALDRRETNTKLIPIPLSFRSSAVAIIAIEIHRLLMQWKFNYLFINRTFHERKVQA